MESGQGSAWPSARYRPATGTIPDSPGVYRFLDAAGKPVYVGKAKRLRDRLSSYFGDPQRLHPRTRAMLAAASEVRWTVVASEVEALVLEQEWIHAFDPRFNVKMRDGRSYPSIALTVGEKYPRVSVWRGERKPGVRFFGPYPQGRDVADTVDALLRVFPVRSCSQPYFQRHRRQGRPCLLADIGKCSAPCVGRVGEEEHRKLVEGLSGFLAGNTKPTLQRLERDMLEASENLEFEKAARRRDDLAAVRRVVERQNVVLDPGVDADLFGSVGDGLVRAWYAFFVRGGAVRGVRSWVVEEDAEGSAVEAFLTRCYAEILREVPEGEAADLPSEVLLRELPEDVATFEAWLGEARGSKVVVRSPKRGGKKDLLLTVERNAGDVLAQARLKRATDLNTRSAAATELGEAVGMEHPPLRIECYDVAHLQGEDAVASMVVFEDGIPRKDSYRTFKISAESAGDDFASMREVLTRRLRHLGPDRLDVDVETGEVADDVESLARAQRGRFAEVPHLIVVDGGAPQVAVAQEVLEEAGVDIPVCGLAKRLEEVWLPGEEDPVILSRSSEALYLLQRLRDEAHRVANTAHGKGRNKRARVSALEEVPGLGPGRRRALLQTFGSVKRIREASAEELAAAPGIGAGLAKVILEHLSQGGRTGGANGAEAQGGAEEAEEAVPEEGAVLEESAAPEGPACTG